MNIVSDSSASTNNFSFIYMRKHYETIKSRETRATHEIYAAGTYVHFDFVETLGTRALFCTHIHYQYMDSKMIIERFSSTIYHVIMSICRSPKTASSLKFALQVTQFSSLQAIYSK